MITILLGIIIGICTGVYISVRNKSAYYDSSDSVFSGFLGLFIGGIASTIIAFALPMVNEYVPEYQAIEALQDNNSIRGSFFLGSGQIDGTMKYIMYVNDGDRFYMVQLDPRHVYIEYTTGKAELVTYTRKRVKGHAINYFALDEDLGQVQYVVQVPKGTIKTNYNLDAQ